MPPVQTTSAELFQACETIFGPEVKVSIDFLEYLQPTGIKTAFRKRAFETHPDRAKALGSFAIDLNEQFINVRKAYERLLSFVETKNEGTVYSSLFNDLRAKQDYSYQSTNHYSFYDTQHKGSFLHRHCTKGKPFTGPVFILLRSYFMANTY
jgi:hypothetical protein